jgi:tRNA threonylcarbamoyl adenosine modification protein YeaZ
MLILTLRTDKPKAEIGLFQDDKQLAYSTWEAHRQLAETIHLKLKEVLDAENKTFKDIEGIVIFKGPGSFTGLRIGFSVANALADSIQIPIVATESNDWVQLGVSRLLNGDNETASLPEYGAPPKTTTPRK